MLLAKHVAIAGVLTALVGCQQATTVEGEVTFRGEPVNRGAITFRPAHGKGPSFGAMISGGRYRVDDASPGEMIATIQAVDESKLVTSREEGERLMAETRAKGRPPEEAIRARYIDSETDGNGQTVEIQPGAQTLDFHLPSTG